MIPTPNSLDNLTRPVKSKLGASQDELSGQSKAALAKALRDGRQAADLTQEQAAQLLLVSVRTISRWEAEGGATENDVRGALQAFKDYKSGVATPLGTQVLRHGLGSTHRLDNMASLTELLRSSAIQGRLDMVYGELREAGASAAYAAKVVSNITNRETVSRLAGGTVDDRYTEAGLLQAINNFVEGAKLGIPPEE